MLPVSSAFLSALRGSHGVSCRARLLGATVLQGADPTPATTLEVVGGSVTLDGQADVRGSLDLEVATAWPTSTNPLTNITPYGSEIAVSRGVVFGNGNVQRAPLGIFRVTGVEQADAPNGPLRIVGQDRMSGIIEARFAAPVSCLATETVWNVFNPLVQAVYPGLTVYWDDSSWTQPVGRALFEEEDRFAFLKLLVSSLGKIMFFDYRGSLVVKSPPSTSGAAVWTVDAGKVGVLLGATRSLSREGIYNGVVARGEGTDETPPVVATVVDLDPSSPTYWYGPFGKVPQFYTSPMLTTTAQAASAAAAILATSVGLPYSVDLAAVVNPALEPFDVVDVTYPYLGRSQTTERHVLDRVTIPLEVTGTQALVTRRQNLTSILGAI